MQSISIIDRGRGPELAGTRITVFDVLHYLQAGRSAEYIADALRISVREVEALIQYIEEHKDEVLQINREIEQRIARGSSPEVQERLATSPTHAVIQARLEESQRRRQEANGEGHPQ